MKEKIFNIIKSTLDETPSRCESVDITLESNLKDDLGLDSFALALLTVQIEDEFNVDIFANDFPQTVSDIVDILNRVE